MINGQSGLVWFRSMKSKRYKLTDKNNNHDKKTFKKSASGLRNARCCGIPVGAKF
jgi:hypothetical protein